MTVYKICKKIGDGKYKSAIVTQRCAIIYELGKTIHRKVMFPLVFKTIEDARKFMLLNLGSHSSYTILRCKASGLIKIDFIMDAVNEEKFCMFWNIYKKINYDRETELFWKNNLNTYSPPHGTFGVKELTPLNEIPFNQKW